MERKIKIFRKKYKDLTIDGKVLIKQHYKKHQNPPAAMCSVPDSVPKVHRNCSVFQAIPAA